MTQHLNNSHLLLLGKTSNCLWTFGFRLEGWKNVRSLCWFLLDACSNISEEINKLRQELAVRSSNKREQRFETSKYLQSSLLSTPNIRNQSEKPLNNKAPFKIQSYGNDHIETFSLKLKASMLMPFHWESVSSCNCLMKAQSDHCGLSRLSHPGLWALNTSSCLFEGKCPD